MAISHFVALTFNFQLSTLFVLVARGRNAGVLFEVLAKEGLGREVEAVGDLLDAHA